jgi:transposase
VDTIVEAKKPADRRRRRTYTQAQKLQILEEAAQPGASVSAVARRHGINDNILYIWRKQRLGKLSPMLPVTVMTERATPSARSSGADTRIEIRTAAGHHIKLGADADAQMVQVVLAALRG